MGNSKEVETKDAVASDLKRLVRWLRIIERPIGYVLLVIAAICITYPLIDWFMNPEITEMQLFIRYWWVYIICVWATFFGNFLLKR